MSKYSGEEQFELMQEYCYYCQYYTEDGCDKSNNIIYNCDEECCECVDYKQAPDAEDEYWERYAYEENYGDVE